MKNQFYIWAMILLAFPLLALECNPTTSNNSGDSLTLKVDTQNLAGSEFGVLGLSDRQLHKTKWSNEKAVDLVNPTVTDPNLPRKVNHLGDELLHNDWTLISDKREKFVGLVAKWGMFNSTWVQETDLNVMVIPNQPKYASLLSEGAKKAKTLEEVHLYRINDPYTSPVDLCPDKLYWHRAVYLEHGIKDDNHEDRNPETDYCITLEAELTPWIKSHKDLGRKFFPTFVNESKHTASSDAFEGVYSKHKNLQFSPHFTNRYPALGLYGPFCMDDRHGNRPEIHPWDWIWWMKLDSSNTKALPRTWMTGLFADDADRFQKQRISFGGQMGKKIADLKLQKDPIFSMDYRQVLNHNNDGFFNNSVFTDAERASIVEKLKLKPWSFFPRTGTIEIPFYIPLEKSGLDNEYRRFTFGIDVEPKVVHGLRTDSLVAVGEIPGNKVSPAQPKKQYTVEMNGKEIGKINLEYTTTTHPEGVAAWVEKLRLFKTANTEALVGFVKIAASTEKVWTAAVHFSDQTDGKISCGEEQRIVNQQVSTHYSADLIDKKVLKDFLRASHTRKALEIALKEPLPQGWSMQLDLAPFPSVNVDQSHLSSNLFLEYTPNGYSLAVGQVSSTGLKVGKVNSKYLEAQKKITITLEVSNNLHQLLLWGDIFNPEIAKIDKNWKRYSLPEFIRMAPEINTGERQLYIDYCMLIPWPKNELSQTRQLQMPKFDSKEGRIVFPVRSKMNAKAGWILWESVITSGRLTAHLQRIKSDFGIDLERETRLRLQNQYQWLTAKNGENLETASYGYYPLIHANGTPDRPEVRKMRERANWTFSSQSISRQVDGDKRLRNYLLDLPEWVAPVALYFDADAVLKGTVNNCNTGIPQPGQAIRRCHPQAKISLNPKFGSPDLRFHKRAKKAGQRSLKVPFFSPNPEGNPNSYVARLNELLESSKGSLRNRIRYFGTAQPFTFSIKKAIAIGRDELGIPDTNKTLSCQSCLSTTLSGSELIVDFNPQIMCEGAAWIEIELVYKVGSRILDKFKRSLIIDPCTISSDDFEVPDFSQIRDPNPCLPKPGQPDPCRSGFNPDRLQNLNNWWSGAGKSYVQGGLPWNFIPARMGYRLQATPSQNEKESEGGDAAYLFLQEKVLLLPRVNQQKVAGKTTLTMTVADYNDLGFSRKNRALKDLQTLDPNRKP